MFRFHREVQPKQVPRFAPFGNRTIMPGAYVDYASRQCRIRRREEVPVEPHIVLETRARLAARGYRPCIQHKLLCSYAGGTPWRFVPKQPLHSLNIKIENLSVDGDGVLDAHDELDKGRVLDPAVALDLCHLCV